MKNAAVVGVDMGGTNIRAGRIQGERVVKDFTIPVSAEADVDTVLRELSETIENVFHSDCAGIGIGVPSVVDREQGIVYDVENIPSWQEVPLRQILEQRFQVPVSINNDANCFALGEACFGKGRTYRHLVGVTLGTGLGTGIIVNRQLYSGVSCGAGEFGILPYAEHDYEYYCGGQFFRNQHQLSGQDLFARASQGDRAAQEIFEQYGRHLGNACWVIVAAFDPELIVLGGSISRAYPFFQQAVWDRLAAYPFRPSIKRLVIEVTDTPNIALLGAAALCHEKGERE